MKLNTKILGLMAALAAGNALAVPSTASVDPNKGTNAGTTISNVATATFDDPSTGTPIGTPVSSNIVTTTVQAKQAFDITYTTGADSDTTDTPGSAPTGYQQTNVKPGQWVAFEYVAVNNGNDKQTITLSTDVTGVLASTVKYYTTSDNNSPLSSANDSNGPQFTGQASELPKVSGSYAIQNLMPAGDDPLTTSVTETNSGMQRFWLVYQVPQVAPNTVVGATPIGTAQVWNGTSNVSVTEQQDAGGVTYDDLWWQYSSATTVKPNVTTTPPHAPTPDPNGPGTPANPGTVVVPPTTPGTVGTGNPGSGTTGDPVDPGDTPADPNVPTRTGYKDGTTVIAIGTNEQHAYPVAGVTTVTFTNVVTNTGTLDDTVTLIPPTGASVTFPGTDADPNTSGFQVRVPAGQTVSYQVEVTIPSTPTSTTNLSQIDVTIGVDSGNDNDTTVDKDGSGNDITTRDIIHPPAFNFGDNNGGTPGASASTKVTETVVPGPNPTPNILSNTTDNVAVFPMNLENTGDYNDSYTLSATTTLTGATVRYFDSTGTELTPDPNRTGGYISPVVGRNSEITVYAVVIVPTGTEAGKYTLTQTATANYSGQQLTDTNDEISVGVVGSVTITKARTNTTVVAVPGNDLDYRIVATNSYNTPVKKFILTEQDSSTTGTNVFQYGRFKAVTATVSTPALTAPAKVMYRFNSGNWQVSNVPTIAPGAVTRMDVGIDSNNDNDITTADLLAPNQTLTVDFTVTIK